MKRYVCTVVTGLLLALVSTGTAAATGLPLPGQTGTQVTSFGDQTVGEQKNDADVTQAQGNGNLNVSPAIALFGDAETTNHQGNGNTAIAVVDQSNSVDQSQRSAQKQYLAQDGGSCCKPSYGCKSWDHCKSNEHSRPTKERCCETGQSQAGEQKTSFGDQHVGEQRNEADVTQKQGNWNGSFAPALALGGGRHHACYSKCGKNWYPLAGNAETTNRQGNGNEAVAWVGQSNSVDQSQTAYQWQSVVERCKGLVYR